MKLCSTPRADQRGVRCRIKDTTIQEAGTLPFIAILNKEGKHVQYAYVDGSLGIALGLLILGWTVMETVGKKVVRLDFAKGFSAQFSTAMSVSLGSIMGLPLSTTHCMVGALFGLILSQKFSPSVKKLYPIVDSNGEDDGEADKSSQQNQEEKKVADNDNEKEIKEEEVKLIETQDEVKPEVTQNEEAPVKKEGDVINRKVIVKILLWWAATVPVACFVAWSACKI